MEGACFFMGFAFALMLAIIVETTSVYPDARDIGHRQGVCDMVCDSRAEVVTTTDEFMCLCKDGHLRRFKFK